MRKFILAIILVIFCLALFAEDKEIPKFKLLSTDTYHLDLRLFNELQRINIIADFAIDPTTLGEADFYTIFMNKAAHIEQMTINNHLIWPILATGLVPEHFEPVLAYPDLLADSTFVTSYSFFLKSFQLNNTIAHFKIRYWIPQPEWVAEDGATHLAFSLDQLWFPRNLETASTVQVKMLSSGRYGLILDTMSPFTDNDGILSHTSSYEDFPNKNLNIKITRKG